MRQPRVFHHIDLIFRNSNWFIGKRDEFLLRQELSEHASNLFAQFLQKDKVVLMIVQPFFSVTPLL
jgi:hypothetical protein